MKLKMAENSVFAILLRSSWWISVVVGAIIVVLCLALLPKDIRFVGAAGSLPFLVIGAMAAKRQWSQPSAAATEALLAQAGAMSSRDLQAWLSRAWQAEGYAVTPVQQGAADLQLARNGQTTLVQTKRSKAGVHGIEPLRALHDAASQAGAASVYVLLQGELSDNARLFARDQKIVLLQNLELATLLKKGAAR
ncbi:MULTISPECIES: restriction endonuclease [Comamonas]|uniref:Restriction endonuclease n=1 Tax=Comamonas squillarum TaxID=2977320 RepID=A0ABY6A0J3_9BURK|nr:MULTISPECIES: restriction endonuclease [Comamonas]PWB20330.1 restriction endonuclease [Comamonas sp. JNW]UXC18239.1 restriction endonuclease [Comamonas sp. PR12]